MNQTDKIAWLDNHGTTDVTISTFDVEVHIMIWVSHGGTRFITTADSYDDAVDEMYTKIKSWVFFITDRFSTGD